MIPRHDFAYDKACEFIVAEQIANLPVNPFEIIKRNRWGFATYKRLGVLACAAGDFTPLLGKSRDGFTIYNSRNYCIVYNDAIGCFSRIVFTLMHEIAHIWLEHLKQFSEEELILYRRELDEEASLFASFVLAPSVVIKRCGLDSIANLRSACGLSHEAAARRLIQFRSWQPRDADKPVERLLDAYIKVSIARRTFSPAVEILFEEEEGNDIANSCMT